MPQDSLPFPDDSCEFAHLLYLCFYDERWLPVPGWPAYEVSNWGRLRSLWTRKPRTIRRGPGWRQRTNTTGASHAVGSVRRILQGNIEPLTGHVHYVLCDGTYTKKTFNAGRLVLMAFDRLPEPGEEARHYYDPDPTNNHLWNLRWGSRTDNRADQMRQRGSYAPAKLTAENVREIRVLLAEGHPLRVIAPRFGVSVATISGIRTGRIWGNVV